MTDHCFISYSTADALDFARKLANKLEGGTPAIPVWFDKDDLRPSEDWDIQIDHALKACRMVLFVMTKDSTHEKSVCRQEWSRALSFKKPIVPLWVENDIEVPFRIADRQRVDFRGEFDRGLAQLREYLSWLDSPEGVLQTLKDRMTDAERDIRRAKEEDKPRIQSEIDELKKQIESQQKIVDDPKGAQEQTQKNIEAGLERERKPEKPVTSNEIFTKFINPPPGIAPTYFQDRMVETEQVVKFLQDDSQRMMTIVGRGGVGKTAMVCRLLKGLEGGELPDGLGRMRVEGIVYLSESGSHRVNFANLFYDLCKLLPADDANALDAVYKNPQASTASKMSALLDRFTAGKVVLLLDNVEPLISVETFDIADAELDECLRALLHGAHSALKVILTTRVAPRGLNLCEPGRQRVLTLDSGLEQKYAVEMLREMDVDGKLGLKSADAEALKRAYERTLGFPRALEALFAILASDRYTTLEELLAMPTPVNVVEALVGEAFNRLDTNAQKVMQALAVYNRPVTPAAVDYLLAPHIPAMDSAPILQRLANMHFARKESGRFYLHPVDREFAFGLIPEKDLTTTPEERGQADTKVTKDFEEEDSVIKVEPDDITPAFDDSEEDTGEDLDFDFDSLFESSRSWRSSRFDAFTQHDLTSRAADYFAQARKPRAEWKKLDDLSAQLAEFDLRCAAGDYDSAASVLEDFGFDYLYLWGHYHLLIGLYQRVIEEIQEPTLRIGIKINLASAHLEIGELKKAVINYEEALILSQENNSQYQEGASLGNLGIAYAYLGHDHKAIQYYEKAIIVAQGIGNPLIEGATLDNIGLALLNMGDFDNAVEKFQKSIQIADGIPNITMQLEARLGLAQAHLSQNDLVNARTAIEAALQYDVPQYNHNASALHGIILLRQGDEVAAREAFVRAIGQADEILSKTAEYYSALDAKGLSICGLAICDLRLKSDDGRLTTDDGRGAVSAPNDAPINDKGRGDPAPTIEDAIESFRKARKIAPHAGIVKRNLRLFDELMKCEGGEILKEVRDAVEGK